MSRVKMPQAAGPKRTKAPDQAANRLPAKLIPSEKSHTLIHLCLGLFVLTLFVYWRVAENGFVNFDDDIYVYGNEHIRGGLSLDNLRWAFTSFKYVYYQPLTWISHMLDVEWFGLRPGGHHLVNVFIHALSSVGLLYWLFRSTGRLWCSAFVSALFALHPLRVESVAWIAERKDVLSTFFLVLALILYYRYAKAPSSRRYALIIGALVLGLLSKPMLVAAPFLFLIVDFWPLQRTERISFLLREKIPMLILAAISSLLTYSGQEQSGAMAVLAHLGWAQRLSNATVSYSRYIGKLFWPEPLTVLYPYNRTLPLLAVTAAALFLVGASLAVTITRRRYPFLFFGWWWYVIAILPVIGIVQAGFQSFADRFSYIPSIGLLVAIVWAASAVAQRFPQGPRVATAAGVVVLIACSMLTYRQIGFWHDGVSLFQHAVDSTSQNYLAEHNLGFALVEAGRNREAVPHLMAAVSENPRSFQGQYNLGKALAAIGNTRQAILSFTQAIEAKPDYAEAYYARGMMEQKLGNWKAAKPDYESALKYQLGIPFQADAFNNLGVFAAQTGDTASALENFQHAVELRPDQANAQVNLAMTLMQMGKRNEALAQLQRAIVATHGDAAVRNALMRFQTF